MLGITCSKPLIKTSGRHHVRCLDDGNVIFEIVKSLKSLHCDIVLIIGLEKVFAWWKVQLECYVSRNFFIVGMALKKLV